MFCLLLLLFSLPMSWFVLKNELKQKEVEVKTAEAEARRMAALANQGSQSIAYMQAQAMLNISEGIKNGKVQTIVVPSNFTALMTK